MKSGGPSTRASKKAQKTAAWLARQKEMAKVIDGTFGELADGKPTLWDRKAYCMIVGMIYDFLSQSEKIISNQELAALSKILAEQQRARPARRKSGSRKKSGTGSGHLPHEFRSVFAQIYGSPMEEEKG